MDVGEAVVLSEGEQDASWAAAFALTAKAAVTNATTGWALPLLRKISKTLNYLKSEEDCKS